MGSVSAGQVVLAGFPFSDLSKQKLRPCLVVGLAEFDDVILCQITSSRYGSQRAVSITNDDFAEGSIVTDSFVRPDKIATLDAKMIEKVLGMLKPDKITEVKEVLKNVFSLD